MAKRRAVKRKPQRPAPGNTERHSRRDAELEAEPESPPLVERKPHAWRICPLGQHWVREHTRHVKVTKQHPNGLTNVRAHCRHNRSGRDEMYLDELRLISESHFRNADPANWPARTQKRLPTAYDPNAFDELIAGWTTYWNEVLKPDVPLDPNIVKALIYSESSYNPNVKPRPVREGSRIKARGLMQVTDDSLDIMADEHGELHDHLLDLDQQDMGDPSANICAGIRWLFNKRRLASTRLGRSITWEEAVAEYKSYLDRVLAGEEIKNYHKVFLDELGRLRKK